MQHNYLMFLISTKKKQLVRKLISNARLNWFCLTAELNVLHMIITSLLTPLPYITINSISKHVTSVIKNWLILIALSTRWPFRRFSILISSISKGKVLFFDNKAKNDHGLYIRDKLNHNIVLSLETRLPVSQNNSPKPLFVHTFAQQKQRILQMPKYSGTCK